MRNLKKILAVITVVAMMATMMVIPALAESFTYENEAKVLNELGLMAGYNLGDEVTRVQGITFAIKAAGKASEVEAMSDEEAAQILADMVVDASEVPAWATKWVAYAVKNGYTSGVDASVAPKVKFAPMQKMTAAELLVWVMNVGMGYKVGTNNAVAKAVEAGIINLNQAMEFGPKAALIRDDIAGILYGACKNGVNADGTRFIESLIKAGFITEDAAIAAGFVEPKPAKLEVVGVKALNLKQLAVEFNMPIKEAGDEANYIIETEDAEAKIDDKSNFELQDDKKTVLITLTQDAAQQEVIDLTVKDIKSESGLKLEETTIEGIEFKDTTIPEAISAQVVGKYTIKVVFSEPIEYPNNGDDPDKYFSVDDGDYLIEKVEKVNNDTEINVTLYSALEEGTVKIEAKPEIKDYAGFGIYKKAFTLDVVEDETGPVVVGYKNAKPDEITLIFDEDIKLTEDKTSTDSEGNEVYPSDYLGKFYHTNGNNTASDLKVDGKELTISFAANKLPEGRAYIYIDRDALQDLWENKNAKISYVVEVTVDTEPPVLDKAEQDGENGLKLTFNENIDIDTAENIENYTILDKDGKEVKDIISSAERTGDKEVTIKFNDNLSGEYTIVVQKVEDTSGNAMAKTTMSFTMKDTTSPDSSKFTAKLYNAGDKKKQMIKVSFGEAMAVSGSYSVVDLDKYVIYNVNTELINLGDWKNASIKAVDGNKAVEIKLPCDDSDALNNKQFELNPDTMTLKLVIARVADAAGNKMSTLTTEKITIEKSGTVAVKSVELTAKDTVVITMTDKLTTFKANDFFNRTSSTSFESALLKLDNPAEITTEDPVEITRIRHTINDDGQSVITLTLAESEKTTYLDNEKDGDGNVTESSMVFKPLKTDSANAYGETIDPATVYVADKAAPVVEEVYYVDVDGSDIDKIIVVFSEEIDDATVLNKLAVKGFKVSGNKAELESAALNESDITLKVGNDTVTIGAKKAVVLTGKNFNKYVDVSYNDAFGMADLNGNAVKSFSWTKTLKEAEEAE